MACKLSDRLLVTFRGDFIDKRELEIRDTGLNRASLPNYSLHVATLNRATPSNVPVEKFR